jgi:ABC-type transporter Mla MlaB component
VSGQKKRTSTPKRVAQSKRAQPKRRTQPERVPQPAPLQLDSRLTIAQAADLHRSLAARLADGGAVVLDGSRVEEIDTAMLQLLASLWRTARERGIPCAWQAASDALRHAATLIGVADALHFVDSDSVRGLDHVPA